MSNSWQTQTNRRNQNKREQNKNNGEQQQKKRQGNNVKSANKPTNQPQQSSAAFVKRSGGGKKRKPTQKGYVKAVRSGDCIVMLNIKKMTESQEMFTPPTETELVLVGVRAPSIGRSGKKGWSEDKPFAFESREFLRKLLIGKTVSFRIEHSTPTLTGGSRNYGEVFLSSKEGEIDVRKHIIENGMVEVINRNRNKEGEPGTGYISEETKELLELQENAKKNALGIFSKNANRAVRNISARYSAYDLFEKLKGQEVPAIVEQVRSGSSLLLYLPKTQHACSVLLSGVQSPIYRFNEDESKQPAFARTARFFTEMRVLNRDVTVRFEGIDKRSSNQNVQSFFVSVNFGGMDLAESLLRIGFGVFQEWSAGNDPARLSTLKKAEEEAKSAARNIWSQRRPASGSGAGPSKKPNKVSFDATVIEIISAGSIRVLETREQGKEYHYRLSFSSIRAPRLISLPELEKLEKETKGRDSAAINKRRADASWAHQAKEYLRKTLRGKKVRCVLDYTFKPNNGTQKSYWSVYLNGKNVSIALLERGFAEVMIHKSGAARSPDYQNLVLAETRAKKNGKGLHADPSKAPIFRWNDLTTNEGQPQKSKSFLGFLQRAGEVRAVVEFVFSGCRMKLWIPRESCMICFNMAGIRSEKTKGVDKKENPLGVYAANFTKDKIFQRDVTVKVLSVDRGGNFVGNLFFNGVDYALTLLTNGIAVIASRNPPREYEKAEEEAKKARRNCWRHYDPELEKKKEEEEAQKRKAEEEKMKKSVRQSSEGGEIVITEVIDGNSFYFQRVSDKLKPFQNMMEEMKNIDFESQKPYPPKKGSLCIAQFSVDNSWYRAEILDIDHQNKTALVQYIDYGNKEVVPESKIRILPDRFQLTKVPKQALLGTLAYIKAPKADADHSRDSADYLRHLCLGKPDMIANVQFINKGVYSLLIAIDSSKTFVNAEMVRNGLSRVKKLNRSAPASADITQMIEKLKEEENIAKSRHLNIWEYGEPGDSDDEDFAFGARR